MKLFALPLALIPFASSTPTSEQAPTSEPAPVVATESRFEVILGFGRQSWTLTLPAGENTHIVVDGDGDSDLDAFLYDQFGNLVAMDNDATDYCILDVTPLWTGTFTLRIDNLGSRANLYQLIVD